MPLFCEYLTAFLSLNKDEFEQIHYTGRANNTTTSGQFHS